MQNRPIAEIELGQSVHRPNHRYTASMKQDTPRIAVMLIGAAMLLVGVFEMAGAWGLLTTLGAIVFLYAALG
jgi:hypothetical protein